MNIKKYIDILSQKKHFTSHDIASNDFTDDMLLNFELFNRLIFNHNDDNTDIYFTRKGKELYLRRIINPKKLLIYMNEMEKIYTEIHLKLIALKEIYQEIGASLKESKQRAILNEIYNLTSSYIIAKNNFFAALTELKTYEMETCDSYINEINSENAITEYEKNLLYCAEALIPKELKEICNDNLDTTDKLAIIERQLELYAHKNLTIDELNTELIEIDNIEKISENRDYLLDRINKLEMRYIVLNDFGPHELDLKPLYEVKFDILTIDIVKQKSSPFIKYDNNCREMNYYKDIIFNRLYTNITGIDSLLSQRLEDKDKYIIDSFKELVKEPLGGYDPIAMLKDKFRLSLILSADTDENMNYFFDNYMIDINDTIPPTRLTGLAKFLNSEKNPQIITENKVPFGTLCWIYIVNYDVSSSHYELQIYNYFYTKEAEKKEEYKIPEGIIEITIRKLRLMTLGIKKCKTFKTPDSMKKIVSISNIWPDNIENVILNEGLEEIDFRLFDDKNIKTLTIPSTLNDANKKRNNNGIFRYNSNIEEIRFTNCEMSDRHTLEDISLEMIILCIKDLYALAKVGILSDFFDIKGRNIVLVSKHGYEKLISINLIIMKEYFKVMKEVNVNGIPFLEKYMLSNLAKRCYDKIVEIFDEFFSQKEIVSEDIEISK